MTDEKRALLGDHKAAKRLTDTGVLLPCPFCGYDKPEYGATWVYCPKCKCFGPAKRYYNEGLLAWNTRAPVLSAEGME